MSILDLPNDVMALMALELDMPSILNYCLTNSRFNSVVCEKQSFWRNKYMRHFPGSRPIPTNVKNAKKYYETIYTHSRNGNLPDDPLSNNNNPDYGILNYSAKNNSLNMYCQTSRNRYTLCKDDNTWKNMIATYYSYIKGDVNSYKERKYPTLTWKQFYAKLVKDPEILQTGFFF